MNKYFNAACLVALTVLFAACGGGSSSDSEASCGALNARIFGGERCDQNARTAVVGVQTRVLGVGGAVVAENFCTGTLITLDDVITSAHCFVQPITEANRGGISIEAIEVEALIGGESSRQVIPAADVSIHPRYTGLTTSRFDVAMFSLQSVPQPQISPVPLLVSELSGPGSEIIAYGYGTNQAGNVGELRSAEFTVSQLAGGNLEVLGDGETSICPGDSGGPAVYVTTQGVTTLAGINSFGRGDCVDTASQNFGFVDVQSTLIFEFILGFAPDVAAG